MRRPLGQGSKKAATTATDTARLPQDILASILIRLPGIDLRRLRRVCKEWRDIITDPWFIQAHSIHGSRLPPTHTIVFFPGFTYGSRQDPGNARGFLLDEHWRLTAEFTAGVWDLMIGACNGLLCFLEAGQGSIKIVEPSTGESLALPLPPEASGLPRWTVNPAAYCFGYDATTRRYKIVHHNYVKYSAPPLRAGEAIDDQEVHVYTVGGGEGWTRLHVAFSMHGRAFDNPAYVDGSVYWPARGHGRDEEKLARLDLATEKITSEAFVRRLQLRAPRPESALFCRLMTDSATTSCVMTYERPEWNVWFPNAQEAQDVVGLPAWGHVVLRDRGGLYLRRVERSLEFGQRELLFDTGKEHLCGRRYKYTGLTTFVPVPVPPHRRLKHLPIAAGAPPPGEQCQARAFGYSPTLSAAPLAFYLGTP